MPKKDPIPKDLFDILACPICRSDLRYRKDKKDLVCIKEGHKYPIKQGIPILLPEEGKKK
ncbi:Trm112 family protein [Candidatus Woesearchaeota archaeon]|nr:Trm112 family protein [Candidatus Woesearchaeota archaeon]